jgi:hypothetical protein
MLTKNDKVTASFLSGSFGCRLESIYTLERYAMACIQVKE